MPPAPQWPPTRAGWRPRCYAASAPRLHRCDLRIEQGGRRLCLRRPATGVGTATCCLPCPRSSCCLPSPCSHCCALQDVYAWGIVMWELLVWELPWRGGTNPYQVPA